MPPCCCRPRVLLIALALLLGGALLTWALVPSAADRRQAARELSPDEGKVRSDVPPGAPACQPSNKPGPDNVTSEDNLPIKIRPLKGSLLNAEIEDDDPWPGVSDEPLMS